MLSPVSAYARSRWAYRLYLPTTAGLPDLLWFWPHMQELCHIGHTCKNCAILATHARTVPYTVTLTLTNKILTGPGPPISKTARFPPFFWPLLVLLGQFYPNGHNSLGIWTRSDPALVYD